MSDTSARLDLPFIAPSQAQKNVTHNEAILRLDALTQLVVEELEATAPPADPALGAIYAIGAAPTGIWAAEAGQLAYWDGAGWLFVAPGEGWQAWDKATASLHVYQGGSWAAQISDLQNVDGLGIRASSDAVNRLSVASEATLLSHEGAGHQLKINKAAAGDTASLLYQSNFTGHAEMGLAGDTDFHIKTSADGGTWYDAMVVEAGSGRVQFPSGAIPAPARAYVTATTAQTFQDQANTDMQYNAVVYDTDGFYNPAAPDRLTVPEDGGYRLSCYVQMSAALTPGEGFFNLERFDSSDTNLVTFSTSLITGYNAGHSPVIACVAGDYFKVVVRQTTGGTTSLLVPDARNYLTIERVF